MLEKIFKLKTNHTSIKTEIAAGITTFMAMAYILAVNPNILGDTGMEPSAVFVATALATFVACIVMSFLSNLPIAISAGMGLNAFFAYTIVASMGFSWKWALAAVFIEGVLFIILTLTKIREQIFDCIPLSLKYALAVGIGIYIAFIGLLSSNIIVPSSTTVLTMFSWDKFHFNTYGISVFLAIVGVLLTGLLHAKKVKGSILIGIIIIWLLGIICQLTGIYTPGFIIDNKFFPIDYVPAATETVTKMWPTLIPDFSVGIFGGVVENFQSLGSTFGQCFVGLNEVIQTNSWLPFLICFLALLFVDIFDTVGTVSAVAANAGMLDKKGNLPAIKGALLSDAIGTTFGAICGTSALSAYIESSTGVAQGGRTGLTTFVVGILFLLSLLLSPLFLAIPSFAIGPALIVVGFLMIATVVKVDLKNPINGIPAFLMIIGIPLTYSISDGIGWGLISYVVLHLATGKGIGIKKKEAVHPALFIIAILFVLHFALLK